MLRLLVFGMGFSARHFAQRRLAQGDSVTGTVRTSDKAASLARLGFTMRVFSNGADNNVIETDIASSDAVLVSVPPNTDGDPVLQSYAAQLATAPNLRWIGYLSTIGVYGDHGGAWVDETTPVNATSIRSLHRAAAERAWLSFGGSSGKSVHIFRLAGIYGPGRNQLMQLSEGTAKRVIKPGQVFNRVHVEDISRTLDASLSRPRPGGIYNVTDDEPAPPQDVVAYAAHLCGLDPPPEIKLEDAQLTPMGRSFYDENKRVRNRLIRDELGVTLAYPTFREGLTSLYNEGEIAKAQQP